MFVQDQDIEQESIGQSSQLGNWRETGGDSQNLKKMKKNNLFNNKGEKKDSNNRRKFVGTPQKQKMSMQSFEMS